MNDKQFVNLGCGNRYHPAWTNIDYAPLSPNVMRHDLRRGIPLPDESVDVLYHSHVLEHFDRKAGREFLRECFRVLRKDGLIRVVTPDLEQLARLYLKALEESIHGSESWQQNYEWIMLELYDQSVRENPGGAMADYVRRATIPNRQFVVERMGKRLVENLIGTPGASNRDYAGKFVRRVVTAFKEPYRLCTKLSFKMRDMALYLILSEETYESVKIGRFRRSGEIHHWMYDRYSLTSVLEEVGFVRVGECKPTTSSVLGWQSFCLDTESDGTIYIPASIYMEAAKA